MNIFEIIKNETIPHRDRIALIEGDDRISYGELLAAVEEAADGLRQAGVTPLSRTGLLCNDSIDYVIASLAILSLAAVIVPISPEQTGEEIATVIDRMDLDLVIAEAALECGGEPQPLPFAGFRRKAFRLLRRDGAGAPPDGFGGCNPAFIRFSSGTTGTSKGVVLSHEGIVERTNAVNKGLRIEADDVILWVLSMSYHFVATILLFLRRGVTTVLCGRRFPEELLEGILTHRGTVIYASPFHYNLLARHDRLAGDSLKHVRLAISTAIKLPERIAEAFAGKFGCELAEAYGIIEVGISFIRLGGGREKRGSVGQALPDFHHMLDRPDGDGVGEILIKGPGMLAAYYSPWRERRELMPEGWFRTGDLGRIDGDGFLFIVGRTKDVINFTGMKIFAQEVEAVINQHPGVVESLVYGAPHGQYGELPQARVVPCAGVDGETLAAELKRFCYQRLAQYKVPKEFEIVNHLPKTSSGKIKR